MKLFRTRLGKFFAVAVALVLLYTAFGFLLLPVILERVAVHQLTTLLGRTVTIRKVDFNPYAMSIIVRGFKIEEPTGRVILTWEALEAAFAPFSSLMHRAWVFRYAVLREPSVNILRSADGTSNFVDLRQLDWPKSVHLQVHLVRLLDGEVHFDDTAVPGRFSSTMSHLTGTLKDFSTSPDHTNSFSINSVSESGELFSWNGSFRVQPLSSQGVISAENVQIGKYSPYFKQRLNVVIAEGELTARVSYDVDLAGGRVRLLVHDGTVAAHSVKMFERGGTAPLFSLSELAATGVQVDLARQTIGIASIVLTGGSAVLRRLPDASFNVQHLIGAGPAGLATREARPDSWRLVAGEIRLASFAARVTDVLGSETISWKELLLSAAKFQTNPPAASIGAITLRDGNLVFTDPSLTPPVTMAMTHLDVRIGGFSSADPRLANVAVNAEIGEVAQLQISGQTNPISSPAETSLRGLLRNINLVPLSPYAAKYLGYELIEGELSLDISLLVQGRKISAQDSIEINRLTFGDRTESTDATKLPVRLVVFLLKDSQGNIFLNVPIGKKSDDSKFELQQTLIDTVLTPFRKAVTFPFAALVGQSGSQSEELGVQEFSSGSAELVPQETPKLDTILLGLKRWPELMLDIEGSVDAKNDSGDLHLLAVDRARTVREYLLNQGTLEPDRIFLINNSPENVPNKGSRALLFLKDRYRNAK